MGCADVCLSMDWSDCTPEFHSSVERVAAKPHKCCECREVIAVGERHEYVVGKWDGEMSSYRTCLACVEIRTTFCCGSWVYGELWETIREEMFPEWGHNLTDIECLARLKSAEAEIKMRQRYAKCRKDNDYDEAPNAD